MAGTSSSHNALNKALRELCLLLCQIQHSSSHPTTAFSLQLTKLLSQWQPPASPYLVQVGKLLVLDEHFLVGELPPAQQAGQLVPVSQFVVAGLGLPRLLLARCRWVRGRRQPLSLGLLLLFLLLFIVAVSSILSQKSYQRVHHLGLREVEGSVTICSIKPAWPAWLCFPNLSPRDSCLCSSPRGRELLASSMGRERRGAGWLLSLHTTGWKPFCSLDRPCFGARLFQLVTHLSTRSQLRPWLFGSEPLSLTSSRNGDQ